MFTLDWLPFKQSNYGGTKNLCLTMISIPSAYSHDTMEQYNNNTVTQYCKLNINLIHGNMIA